MSRKTWALIATILGSGVVFLDGTIVNLALPKIAQGLHGRFSDLQWIADGYLLSLSSLILLGGSLGDIFGRKRIYLTGLVGFGILSLLCGLSPSIGFLIAFRVLQGVFGALLVPGGLAIINTNFPREERGAAIGRWSAWSGILTAVGPLVGGYIIDAISWRWIFFINIPLIIVCGLLASANVDESKDNRPRRVDRYGAVLAAMALAGITYGLIEGPVEHWATKSVLALVIGSVLALAFIVFEKAGRDPMVELSLFRSRNFSGANLMTFAMYGALAGFMFALVIYMQTKLGYSAIKAGISLLPVSLMLLFLSARVGRLSSRIGPRYFLTFGPILAALGMFLLIDYKASDSYLWFLLPRVLLFAIGLTALVAPLTTTVMTSVDELSSGIASGINNAVSRVAGLVVIALLGLAGTGNTYRFSMVLCAIFAAAAGIISFFTIQNPAKTLKHNGQ
ncbi:MAG TPA: MFS transporter [Candidatus Saccharimonadales bacterium]|nr:MFS transporter [Candidatus Saccharimonadales bacterium]